MVFAVWHCLAPSPLCLGPSPLAVPRALFAIPSSHPLPPLQSLLLPSILPVFPQRTAAPEGEEGRAGKEERWSGRKETGEWEKWRGRITKKQKEWGRRRTIKRGKKE